ncbi:hypothetical protein Cob_v003977 [Colletotrichum orbiculare MAFF 240422]|uniref:Uncharacterized protein n=1 Tax=Colletotrichum orbiculare (strain 104-T / ATCC 96160 / CBS 514.97 / LARS 414 / MAFF 240422) TaxID=1213857 RepID=A0A484FZ59_COLOR|nr:hypothetical protein Cob_v003977 [Colletotrichum orbiculare MAFF 240422]
MARLRLGHLVLPTTSELQGHITLHSRPRAVETSRIRTIHPHACKYGRPHPPITRSNLACWLGMRQSLAPNTWKTKSTELWRRQIANQMFSWARSLVVIMSTRTDSTTYAMCPGQTTSTTPQHEPASPDLSLLPDPPASCRYAQERSGPAMLAPIHRLVGFTLCH